MTQAGVRGAQTERILAEGLRQQMAERRTRVLADDNEPRTEVSAVADSFTGLMRAFVKMRARFLAAAEHDVEWSAHVVLRCVANDGPLRAGAVAETLNADPSTISRQVASLVRDGLLQRQADPADGRASLLVVTDQARRVLAEHDEIRDHHFAAMLTDWSTADLRRFGELLRRFTGDFELAQSYLLEAGPPDIRPANPDDPPPTEPGRGGPSTPKGRTTAMTMGARQ